MPVTTSLTRQQALHYASLGLKSICREYPKKPDHLFKDGADVCAPKSLRPAFYGCFDWHSAVHGHWLATDEVYLQTETAVEAGNAGQATKRNTTHNSSGRADLRG